MERYHGFEDLQDIRGQFDVEDGALYFPREDELLFALYDAHDYDGWAWVLFVRDGQLYEVVGSHCSCFGLEEQFDPEPTTIEALAMRNYTWQLEGSGLKVQDVVAWIRTRLGQRE